MTAIARHLLFVAAALLVCHTSEAALTREQCEKQYAPRIGERGKDVIWVPTPDRLALAMLKAAGTTANDYVIDLGAGDGKIPIAAAKHFGARALGVEYNPQLVELAQCNVRAEGVGKKVEIRQGDIFQTDFSQATVLTLYLLSDLNMRLRPAILKLRPGTRVVSNTFRMGDWSPDQFVDSEIGATRAYLWIVPARVAGTWRFTDADGAEHFRISLKQHFQEVTGVVLGSARHHALRDVRLAGANIEFTLVRENAPLRIKGVVEGDRIASAIEHAGKVSKIVGQRE